MLTLDPSKCAQRVKKSKAHNWFWLQLSFDARGSPHVHICKTTFCHKIFFFSQIMSTFNGSKCQPCRIVQNTIIWELFLSRSFMLTWTRTQDSESRAQLCYKERKDNNTAQHEQQLYKKSDYLRNVAVGQRGCRDTSGLCLAQHQGLDQHRLGFCQWRFLTPPPDWEVSGPPLKSDHSLGPAWPKMQR